MEEARGLIKSTPFFSTLDESVQGKLEVIISMLPLIFITIKGIYRDRVFKGIALCALFSLLIPAISPLSMRQVVEFSITLTCSLISAMLLLLSIFLGGSSLWKDIERRYTYSILGLPITRTSYLLSKFFGIAVYLLLTTFVLGALGCGVIKYVSLSYPPIRAVVWSNVFFSIFFIVLKYILLVAIAFLLSTVSTSFFLPIFGTLAVFFVGNTTQRVYDFLHSSVALNYTPLIKAVATCLYYILPNFSAFDLTANAVYGIGMSRPGLLLTTGYFVVYTAIVLTLSSIVFSRREMQ